MSRRETILAVTLVVTGLAAGCEPSPEPVDQEDETARPEVVTIEPIAEFPEEEPEEVEPESAEFGATWPGGADHETFDLTWLGGDEAVELYDRPRADAEVVGSASWMDGADVEWLETVVFVDRPGRLEVETDLELVATPYDREFGELEATDETYRLEEGESLFTYRYDGRGECYLGVETEIVVAECPADQVRFDGEDPQMEPDLRWEADGSQWWVRVEADGQQGWLKVDEAPVEVHPREVEGFEKPEGPMGP